MPNEFDHSSLSPAAADDNLPMNDSIPVLHEVVEMFEDCDIPVLDANYAVPFSTEPPPNNGLTIERIAEIVDTLQITLNRELDYAIDGAVYERLQTAMEEVAASVKKQIHTQLEQKIPELIEQTLGKEN